MKKFALILIFLTPLFVKAQFSYTEKYEKEITFEKAGVDNVLMIANINGDIKVRRTEASNVRIRATNVIKAKTEERLNEGKEMDLGIKDLYDTIIVHLKGICGVFRNKNERWNNSNWNYDWDNCDERFSYLVDFQVEVPEGLNLVLRTINDGDIVVDNISGNLNLKNINGSIKATKVQGEIEARTINGDVDINYENLPVKPINLYSLNGDINLNYQGGLNADLSFKSFNGDLFTNEDNYQQMPMQLVNKSEANGKGITKKMESKSVIRVGKGGLEIDLETFNGDAYVKNVKLNN